MAKQNFDVGANRNWRAIASAKTFWSNRPKLHNGQQILTAKDGRRYVLLDGKANFLKGSQPTR